MTDRPGNRSGGMDSIGSLGVLETNGREVVIGAPRRCDMLVTRWNAGRLGVCVALVCAATGCGTARQQTRSIAVDHSEPVVQPHWTANGSGGASDSAGHTPAGAAHSQQSHGSETGAPRILRERILEGRATPESEPEVMVVQTHVEQPADETAPPTAPQPIGNPLVANLLAEDHRLRLATIDVIEEAARDGYAFAEEIPDANGVTVIVTLRWLAYGYDAKGEWVETSLDVRRRAMAAIVVVDPLNAEFNKPYCTDPNGIDASAVEPQAGAAESGRIVTADAGNVAPSPTTTVVEEPATTPVVGDASNEFEPVPELPEMPAAEVEIVDVLNLPEPEREGEHPASAVPEQGGANEVLIDGNVPVTADTQPMPTPQPVPVLEMESVPETVQEPAESSTTAIPTPPPTPAAESTAPAQTPAASTPEVTVPDSDPVGEPEATVTVSEPEPQAPAARPIPAAVTPSVTEPPAVVLPKTVPEGTLPAPETRPGQGIAPAIVSTTTPVPPVGEVPPVATLKGVVVSVEPRLGTAWIKLDTSRGIPPAGQRLVVIHRYPLGRLSSMGEVEVVRANATHAEVRVIGGTPIAKVAVGDQVSASATR
jgi:hypothetical protein